MFSITNQLSSGSIFSVNDVSGIPSIDVDADGTIQLAPFSATEYVGIGTTNPTAKLDVRGTLNVASTSTFSDEVTISRSSTNSALSIKFGSTLKGRLTPEVSAFKVSANSTNDLRLVCNDAGGTSGDVEIATGGGNGKMALFTGTGTAELYYQDSKKFETTNTGIGISGNIEKYDTLVGSGSTTVVGFAVTVAAKSDHRYTGGVNGASTSGYYLDGIESPFLTLTPGRTYKFNQNNISNLGHPLRFYLDAAKTTQYTEGVSNWGTPGTNGAVSYTHLTLPTILRV